MIFEFKLIIFTVLKSQYVLKIFKSVSVGWVEKCSPD